MNNKITYLIFIIISLNSCKKAEDRECAKSAGNEATKEILLEPFHQLLLKEHMEFMLIQDTIEKIVLKGGKNLLNFIKTDISDGILEIRNENKCNFLRSYKKKVLVEIHFIDLNNIDFQGTEQMNNKDTLQFYWMTFIIRDGAGPVKLNLNADVLHATISHGWGDFTFNGVAREANFFIRSNGFCDTYGLKIIDSLTVISRTQGSVKVNVNNVKFKAETQGDGDIYYKGIPNSPILFHQYGSGELIDAN